jgi:uncharacterized repeat protein (TIGR01451 family)
MLGARWSFDTIEANGTRTILLDLRADAAGLAEVCAEARSAEGQLAQDCVATDVIATAPLLEIQFEGPQTATVGEEVAYTVTITNRGNATATGLVVIDSFDAGLSHAMDPTGARRLRHVLGDLAAGESRPVYLVFSVAAAGRLCHTVEVTTDSGLRAVESACVEATAPAAPLGPALEVNSLAPQQSQVGQVPRFEIVVQNTGDAPLAGVEIQQQFDDALEPRLATEGHVRVGNTLSWILENLAPGQRTVYEVEYELMRATQPGVPARTRTTVTAGQLQRTADSAIEILPGAAPLEPPGGAAATPAPGPDVTLEVLGGTNPVPAGVRTTYQVFVSNQGQAPARDVVLQVDFSAELRPDLTLINRALASRNIQAVREGQVLRFTPIRELPRGERIGFSLPFDPTAPGTARITFSVTSQGMEQPLVMPEQTITVLPQP